jgi:hypothetical protein
MYRWKRLARARGYNPDIDPSLIDFHLEGAPRSGQPTVQTLERTRQLLSIITDSKEG